MAPELILHIGTPKTGSTSLQKVCAANRDALIAQGAYYPTSPGQVQHRLLADAVIDRSGPHFASARRFEGLTPDARIGQLWEDFKREMNALPAGIRTVILSSEHLSLQVRQADEIRALRTLLKPYFSSIRVIVYLRRQDAYMVSRYTQSLRVGVLLSPGEMRLSPETEDSLDYAKLLHAWAGEFGSIAVIPRIFQRREGVAFDTVLDFLGLCDLALPEGARGVGVEYNSSITRAGQRLMLDLGRALKERLKAPVMGNRTWAVLDESISDALPGSGWRPSRQVAQSYYAYFRKGNESVRATWFPDRDTLFDEDFSNYPETEEEPSFEELYQAACTLALHSLEALADPSVRRRGRAARPDESSGGDEQPPAVRPAPDGLTVQLRKIRRHLESAKLAAARELADAAFAAAPTDPFVRKMAEHVRGLAANAGKR